MDKGFYNTLEGLFVTAGVTAASSSFNMDYDPFAEDEGDSLENIDSSDISDYDPFSEDDGVCSFEDQEREREEERWVFENIPKHGVHAHAYKKKLDNLKMKELREKGCTYREIAVQLGCSPSTVRNRLRKMGGYNSLYHHLSW